MQICKSLFDSKSNEILIWDGIISFRFNGPLCTNVDILFITRIFFYYIAASHFISLMMIKWYQSLAGIYGLFPHKFFDFKVRVYMYIRLHQI